MSDITIASQGVQAASEAPGGQADWAFHIKRGFGDGFDDIRLSLTSIASELEVKLGSAFEQAVDVVSACFNGNYGQDLHGTETDEVVQSSAEQALDSNRADSNTVAAIPTESRVPSEEPVGSHQEDFQTFVLKECNQVATDLYRGLRGALQGAVSFFDLSESLPVRSGPPPL